MARKRGYFPFSGPISILSQSSDFLANFSWVSVTMVTHPPSPMKEVKLKSTGKIIMYKEKLNGSNYQYIHFQPSRFTALMKRRNAFLPSSVRLQTPVCSRTFRNTRPAFSWRIDVYSAFLGMRRMAWVPAPGADSIIRLPPHISCIRRRTLVMPTWVLS